MGGISLWISGTDLISKQTNETTPNQVNSASQQQEPTETNFLTYENSIRGIKIDYPSDWTKQEQSSDFIAFLSSQEDDSDNFLENFNLIIQDLSTQPRTLSEYTELSIAEIEQNTVDAKIIYSESITTDGNPSHKLIYSGKGEFNNLKWMQIYIIKDDKAYVLTYTAEEDAYDFFEDIIEEMISSFEFIEIEESGSESSESSGSEGSSYKVELLSCVFFPGEFGYMITCALGDNTACFRNRNIDGGENTVCFEKGANDIISSTDASSPTEKLLLNEIKSMFSLSYFKSSDCITGITTEDGEEYVCEMYLKYKA